MHTPVSNPKGNRVSKTTLHKVMVVCLAVACAGLFGMMPGQARAEPVTLIEENFEEAVPGGRLDPNADGLGDTGISPSIGGRVLAWPGDEAEIVKAWDGLALQFRDTGNGARRLLFTISPEVEPISSGELEVSLDFQIEGKSVSPSAGALLSVTLGATTQGQFLRVDVSSPDLQLVITDGRDETIVHKVLRKEEGFVMELATVYNVKLLVSLDKSTYGIQIVNKATGDVVYETTDLKFLTIPELDTQGIGRHFLNVVGGMGRNEEPLNPVTIDNILVKHK